MSGFFGIVREDGQPPDDRLLNDIAEELRFRGPDGVNVWRGEGVDGGFALMRTGPHKQSERQPVQADDRRTGLLFQQYAGRLEMCSRNFE